MPTSPQAQPSPQPSRDCARRDPRHELGRLGEEIAAAHFDRLGFAIVARNVRTRHGEIDLIAFDGAALVFVEVKTTRAGARGCVTIEPLERLRPRQRVRLRRLARAWLSHKDSPRPTAREIRFDAVGVTLGADDQLLRLDHLEAAW